MQICTNLHWNLSKNTFLNLKYVQHNEQYWASNQYDLQQFCFLLSNVVSSKSACVVNKCVNNLPLCTGTEVDLQSEAFLQQNGNKERRHLCVQTYTHKHLAVTKWKSLL